MKHIIIAIVVGTSLTLPAGAEPPEPTCEVRTCDDLQRCLGQEIPAGYCREMTQEEARSEGLL